MSHRLDLALDLSYDVTKKYTPSYVMEEIYGESNCRPFFLSKREVAVLALLCLFSALADVTSYQSWLGLVVILSQVVESRPVSPRLVECHWNLC